MQKQPKKIMISIAILGLLLGCNDKNSSIDDTTENYSDSSLTFRGFAYNIIKIGNHQWLDRNLGSSSSCNDYKGDPECWGDLYQWGRPFDGHQKRNSSIVSEISHDVNPSHNSFIIVHIKEKDIVKVSHQIPTVNWYTLHDNNLWKENGTGSNEVCPTGWRVPTIQDFEDLNISSSKDSFRKIKLSLGGFRVGHNRNNNGKSRGTSYMGHYWTSTTKKDKYAIAFEIDITEKPFFSESSKASGNLVRCMKD